MTRARFARRKGWLIALGIAVLSAAACQGMQSPAAPATPPAGSAAATPTRASITAISPESLTESTEPSTIVIHGTSFRRGLQMALTGPSGRATIASGDAILNLTETSFELSLALEAGSHRLVVTNADSDPSETFAFSVAASQRPAAPPPPPSAGPAPDPRPTPAPAPEPPPSSSRPGPPAPPAPACAPLTGTFDPQAPGFIVVFNDGTDVDAAVATLSAKYGFTSTRVYHSALAGFSALLSDRVVEALRCEPVVKYVSYNARVGGN
jgi:hypothetical protein